MPSEKLTFDGAAGDRLTARLERPDAAVRGYALFAHCFTCSKDLKGARAISEALAGAGIATLRFDFTGLGESEGDFADTNFSSNVEDLVAAARFLEKDFEAPALLVGHSLGGAAVLKAAAEVESARAVATLGAPASPGHVEHLLADAKGEIEAEGEATVELAGRRFTVKEQFLRDIEEASLREAVEGLDRPLMLFHALEDEIVSIDNATALFKMARHPKSFISLGDADHLLTDPADAAHAGAVLSAWARRYLPAEGFAEEPQKNEGHTQARTPASGLRTDVRAGGFALTADEPTSVPGGTGAGPTPYDLLGAALATCTSMTLRMYADRKEWPLEAVQTRVEHAKIHAEDCAHCETEDGKIDRFTRAVQAEGALSDEQRERLLQIANRCPVHQTLEGEIDIVTVEDEGSDERRNG